MKVLFVFLVIVECLYVNGKLYESTIPLSVISKEKWRYLTKFGMHIGQGAFKFRFKLNKEVPERLKQSTIKMFLHVYLDDNWNQVDSLNNCTLKCQLSHVNHTIIIPVDGQWSSWAENTLNQYVKRHIWYWAISDCDDNIKKLDLFGYKLKIEGRIVNSDETHFSCEESGMLTPYWLLTIFSFAFFIQMIIKFIRQYKKEEEWDWAYSIVILSLIFQVFSMLFESIHLTSYSYNGRGLFVVQLFGQICEIAAQFTLTILLIMISWGWTINYLELDDFDIYIPLAVMLGVIHMMIMGLSKLTDDSHYKHHIYDGITGILIILIRIGLFIYFLFGIKNTYVKARKKVQDFIVKLGLLGTIYLMAIPFIVLLANFVAPYVRHQVVTIGSITLQLSAQILLSYVCTSKKSSYAQIIIKNQPSLPTAKFD